MKRKHKIWEPCNIYKTAIIGDNVNIGAFTEVGNNVIIGNNVRIGAHCFIPEGVTIEDDCWIGPRCTFTNDMFPPSSKKKWQTTIVKRGARLGACVTVLPGLVIGEGALVGAGAVVTKSIPPMEIWVGIPAQFLRGIDMRDGGKHGK